VSSCFEKCEVSTCTRRVGLEWRGLKPLRFCSQSCTLYRTCAPCGAWRLKKLRSVCRAESRLKRRNFVLSLFPENGRVKENREILLCKTGGGDTDARCGHGVQSGSILPRICHPCVAAGLSNKPNSKLPSERWVQGTSQQRLHSFPHSTPLWALHIGGCLNLDAANPNFAFASLASCR
jgi:hypothetical protein